MRYYRYVDRAGVEEWIARSRRRYTVNGTVLGHDSEVDGEDWRPRVTCRSLMASTNEVGYHLASRSLGQGYATEAARLRDWWL